MTLASAVICGLGFELVAFKTYETKQLSVQLWVYIPLLARIGLVTGHVAHGSYLFVETRWHRIQWGTRGARTWKADSNKPPVYHLTWERKHESDSPNF